MTAVPRFRQTGSDRTEWLRLGIGIVAVGSWELFSLTEHELPPVAGIIISALLALVYGRETFRTGLQALLRLDFRSMYFLMFVAIVGAYATRQFAEASTIVVLFALSEELEHYGIRSSRSALKGLLERIPKTAQRIDHDSPIPVEELQVGDTIRVQPSGLIPTDATVVAGISSVDESTITGESMPVDKHLGDTVYAGTMNLNGTLNLKVSATAKESAVSKIVELTFAAAKEKAPSQVFIEKFATIYTPGILIVAVSLLLFPTLVLHGRFNYWFPQALSLLVIGCPCALVISTPISIFSALGAASRQGVIVKGGRSLEAIGGVKVVALDKTRTLTLGKPVVTDVIPMDGTSREHLLACAAGIERYSEHPLARGIMEAAGKEQVDVHPIENFQSAFGMGARAECLVCKDRQHTIGKLRFVRENAAVDQKVIDIVDKLQSAGKTSVLVAADTVEGVIGLADEVRPKAEATIKQLIALKIVPVMLTGDNPSVAAHVAKEVGIEHFYAELLPDQKAMMVRELKSEYGSVCMVGDGVNDAPALATATVGVAMGASGSDMAIETASIALMNDNITLLPFLIKLGRRTVRVIRINLLITILVKLLFISLAVLGISNLALAILADVGVTLVVVGVGLSLLRYDPQRSA